MQNINSEAATFAALQLRIVIDTYGDKLYYNSENKLHRVHGAAIECANGDKAWLVNGKQHRTEGPAVVHVNGVREWFINDKRLTEKKFLKHPLCTIK